MKDITIRKATKEDLDTLYEFEQGVIQAERPFDPTLKKSKINYYNLPEMLTASHIHLVVAEYEKQAIGCGYTRIEKAEHFLAHEQHAYVGFMYTAPAYRGKGVNQLVLAELKRWAQSKGITEMRLEVYAENLSAMKAYEKAGFTKHMIEMRMGI